MVEISNFVLYVILSKKDSFLSVCVVSVKAQLHCSHHGLELLKITHISNRFFTWGVNFDWLRSVILFCSLIQKKKFFVCLCCERKGPVALFSSRPRITENYSHFEWIFYEGCKF